MNITSMHSEAQIPCNFHRAYVGQICSRVSRRVLSVVRMARAAVCCSSEAINPQRAHAKQMSTSALYHRLQVLGMFPRAMSVRKRMRRCQSPGCIVVSAWLVPSLFVLDIFWFSGHLATCNARPPLNRAATLSFACEDGAANGRTVACR
jgi:hypothetical protein